MTKTAIVIGVGPDRGLGAQICKRFAANGFKAIVTGRAQAAIEAVTADNVRAGGQAVSIVADATSESDIGKLFDAAGTDLDLAVYNAGNNTPGKIIDMDASYFEQSWRVVCFGGFLFGREVIRRMLPKRPARSSSPAPARFIQIVSGAKRVRYPLKRKLHGSIVHYNSPTVGLHGVVKTWPGE